MLTRARGRPDPLDLCDPRGRRADQLVIFVSSTVSLASLRVYVNAREAFDPIESEPRALSNGRAISNERRRGDSRHAFSETPRARTPLLIKESENCSVCVWKLSARVGD